MVYGAASVYKGINLRGREAYTTVPNMTTTFNADTSTVQCSGRFERKI